MRLDRIQSSILAICAVFVGLVSSGCGKSIVTHASISTALQNNEQWAYADVQFKTSGITLPSVTLPVFNPQVPSVVYGQVQLDQLSGAIGELKVNLNLSQVAQLPGGDAQLPNGADVPVIVPDQVKLVAIPIPNVRFVLYLAFRLNVVEPSDSSVLMLGMALPFTQFDSIGNAVGKANLFVPFSIQGVSGTAGIFSGSESGTSGIGIFVDFSKLIPPPSDRDSVALGFLKVSPGERVKRKMKQIVRDLQRHGTVLTLD